jgi:hypothetical protein
MIYDFTKSNLERVSVDPIQFRRELNKAKKCLQSEEMESLAKWLYVFTNNNLKLKKIVKRTFTIHD